MHNRLVKFFNNLKGVGFTKDENPEQDYFVQGSGLMKDINENNQVTFNWQEGRKDLHAFNVNFT